MPDAAVQTFTYKTVADLEIRADVCRPAGDATCPVVLFIHGGALMMGHREAIDGGQRDKLVELGCATVSIDYRLAPETALPAIIEDIEDAYTWIVREGPALFGADATRIAVTGGSAGGYLTLVTGYRCRPRPIALVSFYGYGDLVGPWYSSPSPHPRHHSLTMTDDEARQLAASPPVSDDRDRSGDGSAYYQRCRQLGTWPHAVSGWDPHSEVQAYNPYMPAVNVDAEYPPTLLIHGTEDTDVPYEQSVTMARELRAHGVEHALLTIDGAEHGLGGGPKEQVANAFDESLRFIDRFLQAAGSTA